MTRAATWSNPDGLIVGFGPNYADRNPGGVLKDKASVKTAKLQFTFQSTLGSTGDRIPLPAGSIVKNVYMKVGTAWVGGTSLAFGDGGGTGGFISATQGATANLTAGASIQAGGTYVAADTDTTAAERPKVYAAATDLFVTVVGTFTAGTADIYVEYV
jgi:hypothetical protein